MYILSYFIHSLISAVTVLSFYLVWVFRLILHLQPTKSLRRREVDPTERERGTSMHKHNPKATQRELAQ